MMNDIQTFGFQGNQVRVIMINEEPWWVAKDICAVLDYTWAGSASIKHVPECWRGVNSVLTPSGDQDMSVLSEQGVYFFLGRSDKPKALPFQMWLAGEVVPSIRKNGMYATPELLGDPEHLLRVTQRLVDEHRGRLTAEAKVAELAPKAAFHDQVAETTNCIPVAKFAKLMGTGEKRMFAWLRSQGLLMTGNVPYQRYIDEGYFKVREGTYPHPGDEQQERCSYTQTTITGKGQTYLQKRWAKDGNAVQLRLVEG